MCQNLCVFWSFTRIKRPQPNYTSYKQWQHAQLFQPSGEISHVPTQQCRGIKYQLFLCNITILYYWTCFCFLPNSMLIFNNYVDKMKFCYLSNSKQNLLQHPTFQTKKIFISISQISFLSNAQCCQIFYQVTIAIAIFKDFTRKLEADATSARHAILNILKE